MMNARKILEFAKAVGYCDIAPGYKIFAREYFRVGRIVDLGFTHRIEIAKDGIFRQPFVFVTASEISGGEPDIAECGNEKKALLAIKAILRDKESA
jgi:hypothetical protein